MALLAATTGPGPAAASGSQGETTVSILLDPSSAAVVVGQTITMNILVEAGDQPVSGVQAYLSFDPEFFQVVDSEGNPAGQVERGTALPAILINSADNDTGEIQYSAGKLGEPFPTGTFVLASVTFRALQETPGTAVVFAQGGPPSGTFADFAGDPLPTELADAEVSIIASPVDISLEPSEAVVDAGQTFTMDVVVDAGDQEVSGVQAFLDFDPTKLQVQDADGDPDNGIQIEPGAVLPTVLTNIADNEAGQIDFAAGMLEEPFPSGTFVLATITFRAVEATASTEIVFATEPETRETLAEFLGAPLPVELSGATVAIRVGLFLEPVDDDPTDQFIQVRVGETFDVDVKVAAGDQPVAGVQAFVNFNPELIQVVDADPVRPGVQVQVGGVLVDFQDVNQADNTAGHIDFAAGNLALPGGSGFATGTFVLATIKFRAVGAAEGALVEFSISPLQRETLVSDPAGTDVTGAFHNATVEIIPSATLRVVFQFQGGARPRPAGWEQPVAVELVPASGGDPLVFNVTSEFDSGRERAIATVGDVPLDTYDLYLTGPSTLTNVIRGLVVDATAVDAGQGVLEVDAEALLSGNSNGDGTRSGNQVINILDFGVLAGVFGLNSGDAGFDARADFDANNVVNISDFGLLSLNFLALGPVEVGAPEAAPDRVTLRIDPPSSAGESGEQATISVVADGAQDMAGVQFDLEFDNTVVRAVSAEAGNNLPGGALFVSNTNSGDGPVIVAISQSTALGVDSVTLARITFDLVGVAGQATPLALSGVVVAGEDTSQPLPFDTVDGDLVIN